MTQRKSKKVIKRPHKTLWGYTAYGPHSIKIYKSRVNPLFDGLTFDRKSGYVIEIGVEVFEQPSLLDEVLIHEFIHVIEGVHGLNWESISYLDGSCSQAVSTLGHGLAQMLRELTQI